MEIDISQGHRTGFAELVQYPHARAEWQQRPCAIGTFDEGEREVNEYKCQRDCASARQDLDILQILAFIMIDSLASHGIQESTGKKQCL